MELVSPSPDRLLRLVARTRGPDVDVDPDVDQRGRAGSDRLAGTLERWADLAGLTDFLAIPAEDLRELVERDVAEPVADVAALLAVLHDLAAADLVHR